MGAISSARSGDDLLHFRTESAWVEKWSQVSVRYNEDTPECRSLYSDIDSLSEEIGDGMAGTDNELKQPPSVYPGIVKEVFDRLVAELW